MLHDEHEKSLKKSAEIDLLFIFIHFFSHAQLYVVILELTVVKQVKVKRKDGNMRLTQKQKSKKLAKRKKFHSMRNLRKFIYTRRFSAQLTLLIKFKGGK